MKILKGILKRVFITIMVIIWFFLLLTIAIPLILWIIFDINILGNLINYIDEINEK
jgi:hypothetical protein